MIPTATPTTRPTLNPSIFPTRQPTEIPSIAPTSLPTLSPTFSDPIRFQYQLTFLSSLFPEDDLSAAIYEPGLFSTQLETLLRQTFADISAGIVVWLSGPNQSPVRIKARKDRRLADSKSVVYLDIRFETARITAKK